MNSKTIQAICILCLISTKCVLGCCPPSAKYRTYDGSCNNLYNPTWGRAGTTQRRVRDRTRRLMVAYGDGVSLPRGYPGKLPDPRLVSNALTSFSADTNDRKDSYRTGQHMSFGQLLAHDFIETKVQSSGSMSITLIGINCCNKSDPFYNRNDVCFPFHIPTSDTILPTGCKNFVRTVKIKTSKQDPHFESINLLSSFIDCSFLYGDSEDYVAKLREPYSCLLKTDPGNVLPTTNDGSCFKLDPGHDRCPLSGDRRAHEAPNLGLNLLAFLREHNRICEVLQKLNPHWGSEVTFQETRKLMIAQVQHITYNHFLPLVIGEQAMCRFKLYSKQTGYNDVYDRNIDPSIFNSFGAATWRYGHSQIMPFVSELKEDFYTMYAHRIEDHLLSPNLYQQNYGKKIKDLSRWLVSKPAQRIDSFLVDGIRNKLFYLSSPPGTDLLSINIQRGRDQGVPGYNEWRKVCGLREVKNFTEFGLVGDKLETLYSYVDEVDLYVGGILEASDDGRVGATFACLIGLQFKHLKVGDRFWYETSDPNLAFSKDQLNSIKSNSSLSKIWCRNLDLQRVQPNIFTIADPNNQLMNCEDLPDIDLTLWMDKNKI